MVRLPLGVDSFSKICEGQYYYIDKTQIIAELLKKQFKAMLLTRPRRFGKTLTMSMLEDFFDISRDSGEYFAGLAVSENSELCEKRALVTEIKHADKESDLKDACARAVRQIQDRKYLQGIEKGYRTRTGYGIAFFKKECMVQKATEQ